MMKRFFPFYFIIALSGCFTTSSDMMPVSFGDAYVQLDIQDVEPTPEEAAGITLRLSYPPGTSRTFIEETVIFSGITGAEGKKSEMRKKHTDEYEAGQDQNSFMVTTRMVIDGSRDTFNTIIEIDSRGSILAVHEGINKTGIGNFEIAEWERSAIFPEGKVVVGDEWTYIEGMILEIKSWLIKDRDPKPMTVKARSTLRGFALVNGRRCAKIEAVAIQEQQFNFRVTFFKLNFTTKTSIEETLFFDYERGVPLARVITTRGRSVNENGELMDISEIQSVEYFVEEQF